MFYLFVKENCSL